MKLQNKKGFTLLEILVVISLILIIVGIAVPKFLGVGDEGKKAKAAADLKTVQTALESYLLNTSNSLPAATNGNLTDLTALEGTSPRLVGDVNTMYDPFAAASTTYKYQVNGDYYVIWSLGPNNTDDMGVISNAGLIAGGVPDDDIYVSNGSI